MSAGGRTSRRAPLFALAAVHFTHVMDLIIMMPLGAVIMREFAISPTQFSWLVATYSIAAAFAGLAGGFVLDRVDRRRALLAIYAGFAIATLACAFAPGFGFLLPARFAAGACGGLMTALSNALVGDLAPPEKRGGAIALVMAGWPLGSALGVPTALIAARFFDWHGPFVVIALLSVPVWIFTARALPAVPPRDRPVGATVERNWLTRRTHLWALAAGGSLMFAPSCVLPFMAASTVANAGLAESSLMFIYVCSGSTTIFTTTLFGRLSDRFDKFRLVACTAPAVVLVSLLLTRLGPSPAVVVLTLTTLFYVSISSLHPPVMTLIVNAVDPRARGAFMSVNSAVQQAVAGGCNLLAGSLVTRDAAGHLAGYPMVGVVASVGALLVIALAWRLTNEIAREAEVPAPVPGIGAASEMRP